MWVLSRKKDESLVINDNIIITVIEIRGDKVPLGVECPKELPVNRNEVYEAIRRIDEPSSVPPSSTQEPPSPHIPPRQPDRLDRLAAALQSRLGVPVSRELVAQALREAGIDEPTKSWTL